MRRDRPADDRDQLVRRAVELVELAGFVERLAVDPAQVADARRKVAAVLVPLTAAERAWVCEESGLVLAADGSVVRCSGDPFADWPRRAGDGTVVELRRG